MKLLVKAVACMALFGTVVAQAAETVKVGVVSSFSGPFARHGAQMKYGIEAYQAIHGTAVNGVEIKVVYRDDGGPDPARTKQLVEELVLREKVQFLGGFVFSPNILASAPIIDEARIPTVIFGAIAADLTRKSPYIVRTSYTNPQVVVPIGTWAVSNGIKKVITIVSDYSPGRDAETYFVKAFKAAGGEVMRNVRVPLSANDFAPFFEQIQRDRPDAVFMFAPGGPPAVGMINAWSNRGLREAGIKLLVSGETQQIDLPSIGDAALGIVSSFHYTETIDNPANRTLVEALKKLGKDVVPDYATVGAFDGMHVIYEAVRKRGARVDGSAAIEAMKGLSFASPRGPMLIDPKTRDAVHNVYFRRVEKKNGILVNTNFGVVPMVKDPWKEENPN